MKRLGLPLCLSLSFLFVAACDTGETNSASDETAESDPRCAACFDGGGPDFTCDAGDVDCGTIHTSTGYSSSPVEACEASGLSPSDCPQLEAHNAEVMACVFDLVASGTSGTVRWEYDNLAEFDERSLYFRDDGTVFDLNLEYNDSGTNWAPQQLHATPADAVADCAEAPDSLAQWDCVASQVELAEVEATCLEDGEIRSDE